MHLINRAVVVLTPKQPYADWANRTRDEAPPTSLEETRRSAIAFLIPGFELTQDMERYISDHAEEMFTRALADWDEDRSRWPQRRNHLLLREWFDVDLHDLVIDLAVEPLEIEDVDA